MTNNITDSDYQELTVKIDMVIKFLESHGGTGYEMYSFVDVNSNEEVSFDIVDVALDIKGKIDCLYHSTDELPF